MNISTFVPAPNSRCFCLKKASAAMTTILLEVLVYRKCGLFDEKLCPYELDPHV